MTAAGSAGVFQSVEVAGVQQPRAGWQPAGSPTHRGVGSSPQFELAPQTPLIPQGAGGPGTQAPHPYLHPQAGLQTGSAVPQSARRGPPQTAAVEEEDETKFCCIRRRRRRSESKRAVVSGRAYETAARTWSWSYDASLWITHAIVFLLCWLDSGSRELLTLPAGHPASLVVTLFIRKLIIVLPGVHRKKSLWAAPLTWTCSRRFSESLFSRWADCCKAPSAARLPFQLYSANVACASLALRSSWLLFASLPLWPAAWDSDSKSHSTSLYATCLRRRPSIVSFVLTKAFSPLTLTWLYVICPQTCPKFVVV